MSWLNYCIFRESIANSPRTIIEKLFRTIPFINVWFRLKDGITCKKHSVNFYTNRPHAMTWNWDEIDLDPSPVQSPTQLFCREINITNGIMIIWVVVIQQEICLKFFL